MDATEVAKMNATITGSVGASYTVERRNPVTGELEIIDQAEWNRD